MIKLTKKEINKIKGFAHYYTESYEQAITYLEKIENDAHVYEAIAYSYMYLRDYQAAQEYALKAIELGRESAYVIYTRVTTDNLQRHDLAFNVLKKGVEKHSAQACLSLANMGLDYNGPQKRSMFAEERMELLEKAWKYSKVNQKGIIALNIALSYKGMIRPTSLDNDVVNTECEIRAGQYFRLANELDCARVGIYSEYMFVCFSENTPRKERNLILDSLLEHFDYHSALYFGLLLIQNGPKKIATTSEAWKLFGYGMSKGDNACALLFGLTCGSHMPGSLFDVAKTQDLFNIIYRDKRLINVPKTLKETYLSLIENYDNRFNSYLKELEPKIYDPK